MRASQYVVLVVFVLTGFLGGESEAQQIYRWTDENGRVHFGNQPPRNARQAETRSRERSGVEIACDNEVKERCRKYVKTYGNWQHSKAYRNCLERGRDRCKRVRPKVRPTVAPERFVSTPALPFDPALGETLRCEMHCSNKCRGKVEIRSDRVLKRGENYGSTDYEMEIKPRKAGSAFCTASTSGNDVRLVLSVLREGSVRSSVEGQ